MQLNPLPANCFVWCWLKLEPFAGYPVSSAGDVVCVIIMHFKELLLLNWLKKKINLTHFPSDYSILIHMQAGRRIPWPFSLLWEVFFLKKPKAALRSQKHSKGASFCLPFSEHCPLSKFILKTRVAKFRQVTHKAMSNVIFKAGRDTGTWVLDTAAESSSFCL